VSLPAEPTSPPRVQLEYFEGPLDLLLDEVCRQNVAIEKIAMAPIVSRFLDYMETAADRNLNLDIEWLHMAATLIHWKSRSLLGSQAGEDSESDPIRDSLVEQLRAYRKELAGDLARRRSEERARFSRPHELAVRVGEEVEEPGEPDLNVWDLIQQSRELAGWVEDQWRARSRSEREFAVEAEGVTVDEMIGYLTRRLAFEGELEGTRLLREQTSGQRQACLFLGMLQMACDRQLDLDQAEAFGPIRVALFPVGPLPTVGPTPRAT
jgi:segregation and condensation protein A